MEVKRVKVEAGDVILICVLPGMEAIERERLKADLEDALPNNHIFIFCNTVVDFHILGSEIEAR